MTILVLGLLAAAQASGQGEPARAFHAATAAVRKPGTMVRVDLIGDSTQTNNAGYGRGFCANLKPTVDCVNMAKGCVSTKTFSEQELWERSLETRPPEKAGPHTPERAGSRSSEEWSPMRSCERRSSLGRM